MKFSLKFITQRLFLATLLGLACTAAQAAGQSAPSQASAKLSATVVGGSVTTLAAGGSVVVASVQTVAEGVDIVLENVADGSRATVRLSSRAAGGLSLAAGATLEVAAASTGYVLVMAGKAIAFLPNEAGKALLHHGRAM